MGKDEKNLNNSKKATNIKEVKKVPKVRGHRRAIKNSMGQIVGYIYVNPHIRTRPTKRWSIRRKRR